jgi:hypothetical protein
VRGRQGFRWAEGRHAELPGVALVGRPADRAVGGDAAEKVRAANEKIVAGLKAERQALAQTERERFVAQALSRLSAEATAQQRREVEQLAGALFDEQQALQARQRLLDEGRSVIDRTRSTWMGPRETSMSFRRWNHQLRQPILLATADAVIARAALPDFLHRTNALDTLGAGRSRERLPFLAVAPTRAPHEVPATGKTRNRWSCTPFGKR